MPRTMKGRTCINTVGRVNADAATLIVRHGAGR